MSHADKVRKKVENHEDYYAFYRSVIGLGVDDLKKNLLMYQKHLQETIVKMKTNPEIIRLEGEKRKAEKPYIDRIKESKDKIKQLKSFVDDSICVEDLEQQIIIQTMKSEDQKQKMSEDVDVINAKNELSEAKGPFNDAKTVLEFKISYLYLLIEEKGGALYED